MVVTFMHHPMHVLDAPARPWCSTVESVLIAGYMFDQNDFQNLLY